MFLEAMNNILNSGISKLLNLYKCLLKIACNYYTLPYIMYYSYNNATLYTNHYTTPAESHFKNYLYHQTFKLVADER